MILCRHENQHLDWQQCSAGGLQLDSVGSALITNSKLIESVQIGKPELEMFKLEMVIMRNVQFGMVTLYIHVVINP